VSDDTTSPRRANASPWRKGAVIGLVVAVVTVAILLFIRMPSQRGDPTEGGAESGGPAFQLAPAPSQAKPASDAPASIQRTPAELTTAASPSLPLSWENPTVLRVFDSARRPVPGASVSPFVSTRPMGVPRAAPSVTTDRTGIAKFFLPNAGSMRFCAEHPESGRIGWSLETLPGETSDIILDDGDGGTLSVRVVDPSGQGLPGAHVRLSGSAESLGTWTLEGDSDSAGRVAFRGVPAGSTRLFAWALGHSWKSVAGPRSRRRESQETEITLEPSGFVSFDAVGEDGARVDTLKVDFLTPYQQTSSRTIQRSDQGFFRLPTPPSGPAFVLSGPTGEARVVAFDRQHLTPSTPGATFDTVTLQRSTIVRGKLDLRDEPSSVFRLELTFVIEPVRGVRDFGTAFALPAADGTFTIAGVPADTDFILSAHSPAHLVVPRVVGRTGLPGSETAVHLVVQAASFVDVVVWENQGQPIAGALIRSWDSALVRLAGTAIRPETIETPETHRTDSNGAARLRGHPGQARSLEVSATGYATQQNLYPDFPAAGASTAMEIDLSPETVIHGLLQSADGKGVRDVSVEFYTPDDIHQHRALAEVNTNEQGQFVARINGRFSTLVVTASRAGRMVRGDWRGSASVLVLEWSR
jgi:hypothetical protein